MLLARATETHGGDAPRRFRVIHVIDDAKPMGSERAVTALREKGIKVSTIPNSAVAYAMEQVDRVVVGAEAVTSNAGIISRLGTYQIALVAKAYSKEFFVAAEQYKFGDTYPEAQSRLGFPGFKQNIVNFQSSRTLAGSQQNGSQSPADPVDYTVRSAAPPITLALNLAPLALTDRQPPEYITSFFTDQGDLTPQAVRKNILDFIVDKPVELPM